MSVGEVWLMILSIDAARYLIAAGGVFLALWVIGRQRFARRWIRDVQPKVSKIVHDVKWSASTVLIFSVTGVVVYFASRAGYLRRYETIAEHGWVYFFFSIAALIVLQDAYFYWTHRAMHHPWLFRRVHALHHRSVHTSPWTAYAFSPIEAMVHAAIVPLVMVFMPLHDIATFLFLAFMMVRNALGHANIELYARGFTKHRVLGHSTTTTHHALHHLRPRTNFGLYFTWWDRLMGTTDERYHEEFDRVVTR